MTLMAGTSHQLTTEKYEKHAFCSTYVCQSCKVFAESITSEKIAKKHKTRRRHLKHQLIIMSEFIFYTTTGGEGESS